jgi:hypothetical protein
MQLVSPLLGVGCMRCSLCAEVRYVDISYVNLHQDVLTGGKGIKNKFTARGVVRGASLALCAVNIAGCGLAYTFGKREKEEKNA